MTTGRLVFDGIDEKTGDLIVSLLNQAGQENPAVLMALARAQWKEGEFNTLDREEKDRLAAALEYAADVYSVTNRNRGSTAPRSMPTVIGWLRHVAACIVHDDAVVSIPSTPDGN